MAVALELAWRAFGAFPGACARARVVLLALLAAQHAGARGLLTPRSSYRTLWEWQPSVATAALWLLTATALLVVWYQVPVHDWQRAIMLGPRPVPARLRDPARPAPAPRLAPRAEMGLATRWPTSALLAFWAWAAWRRDPSPPLAGSPA